MIVEILAGNRKKNHLLLLMGDNSNKKSPDNFDPRTMVGVFIRIISAIERFFLSFIVCKTLVDNCKQSHFHLSMAINLTRNRSTTLFPCRLLKTFYMIRIISAIFLNLTVVEIYAKNFFLITLFYFSNGGNV